MLILCSGPDTYRAITKAQELERAFRQKFDPSGTSIERIASNNLEELAKRIDTVSLFSPKRFIRFDNLITLSQKSKKDDLAKIMAKNVEDAIVVTVEEEAPEPRQVEKLKQIPKFVHYPQPHLNASQFEAWVESKARELGEISPNQVRQISEACFPDSWFAISELMKAAAGNSVTLEKSEIRNPYSWAEEILLDEKKNAGLLATSSEDEDNLPALLNAARLLIKIKGGQTQGLHPTAVQKLKGKASLAPVEAKLADLTSALLLQRAGYGTDEELLASL